MLIALIDYGAGNIHSIEKALEYAGATVQVTEKPSVVAKAQAKWNGTGSGSASTTLTNVLVAGVPVANYPAPNTRIPILGLGYVILNEQSSNVSSSAASESVNGIHVYVTQSNAFGLSVGAQIIIGHADAKVTSFS